MDGIPSAAPATSPTRFDSSAVSNNYGEKYEYSGAAQVTGKYEKVLGETDGNVYLWTVLYYDDRGRVVQESHSTHRGGWQRTNTGYDFTGHPLKTKTVSHDEIAGDMTEHYTYYYDAWGRPLTVLLALNNYTPSVIHNYLYDGAGRMIRDGKNGNANLATTCAYNVRSWLTDIWVGGNANQGTLGESFTERYDFAYDGLSRLTGASYGDSSNGTGLYNRAYTYDRNGNITSVTTPSATTQLYYSGNQFAGGGNYSYDANGNLIEDYDRLITSIEYNIFNLPSEISTCDEVSGNGIIGGLDGRYYLYSASGEKLQEKEIMPPVLLNHPDNRARTDYVGNLIYDRTSLKKVLFPGGYAEASGNSWLYRYFVTDHLGNVRLVTDASGTILQTNHYDPYGESLPAGAAADSGNPYKWGGKEYVGELDSYDFGARYYTTSIPRWTTMDPLCEKYYSISPYAYCAGNPVNLVDPNGLCFYTDEDKAMATRLEKQVERKAKWMERWAKVSSFFHLKSSSQYENRALELRQTLVDLQDMRTQKDMAFHFEKYNESNIEKYQLTTPQTTNTTDENGNTVYTLYTEGGGNTIHEVRHGGQLARGEYGEGNLIQCEVSAYRAQFAWDGFILYPSVNQLLQDPNYETLINQGLPPTLWRELYRPINQIDMVNKGFVEDVLGIDNNQFIILYLNERVYNY